jgi:hypothetical protein
MALPNFTWGQQGLINNSTGTNSLTGRGTTATGGNKNTKPVITTPTGLTNYTPNPITGQQLQGINGLVPQWAYPAYTSKIVGMNAPFNNVVNAMQGVVAPTNMPQANQMANQYVMGGGKSNPAQSSGGQ